MSFLFNSHMEPKDVVMGDKPKSRFISLAESKNDISLCDPNFPAEKSLKRKAEDEPEVVSSDSSTEDGLDLEGEWQIQCETFLNSKFALDLFSLRIETWLNEMGPKLYAVEHKKSELSNARKAISISKPVSKGF